MMRLFSLLVALSPLVVARLLHSIPEDPHAFPKFRVSFLDALPSDTARQWLTHGLRGGLLEFLDHPWNDDSPREIDGAALISTKDPAPPNSNYTLEYMRMGSKDLYLCLIPNPLDRVPSVTQDDVSELEETTPSRSWSLLQPLSGTCLYHRQGWFTYSYCHNDQIRQFKEAAQAPDPIGGHKRPEEDTEWEAYTLGKAPKPGADLTTADKNAEAANIELAHGHGSRYLVQRWGDGTLCDKTGHSREVEVQFHCSMTMTDTILFVKETKTCSYVLVIHTPRLCGEPGFKSLRDKGEESLIQCREVLDVPPSTNDAEKRSDHPGADHPIKLSRKRPVLPLPAGESNPKKKGQGGVYGDLLRKTIETIFSAQDLKQPSFVSEGVSNDDDELMFEFVDAGEATEDTVDRLLDMLRAAGINAKAEKLVIRKDEKDEQPAKKTQEHKGHDEL